MCRGGSVLRLPRGLSRRAASRPFPAPSPVPGTGWCRGSSRGRLRSGAGNTLFSISTPEPRPRKAPRGPRKAPGDPAGRQAVPQPPPSRRRCGVSRSSPHGCSPALDLVACLLLRGPVLAPLLLLRTPLMGGKVLCYR